MDQYQSYTPPEEVRGQVRSLARRILDLNDEIAELDRFTIPLVEELAANLLELERVGTDNAGAMMVVAGENPDRRLCCKVRLVGQVSA